jgi:hypothetical protein
MSLGHNPYASETSQHIKVVVRFKLPTVPVAVVGNGSSSLDPQPTSRSGTSMSLWREITQTVNELLESHYLSAPTWLAVGAALQLLALACLPAGLSGLPAIIYLTYCGVKFIINSKDVIGSYKSVKRGRWVAELPEPVEDEKDSGLVLFVLASRLNQ